MSAYFYKQVFFISIHAPREGGDLRWWKPVPRTKTFQSTPPARGATTRGFSGRRCNNFNPRPPRGGATANTINKVLGLNISIHAPREGGRRDHLIDAVCVLVFQSTPPARGGDRPPGSLCGRRHTISIHAPREGGRLAKANYTMLDNLFQSTPPARGGDPMLT